jgi:predicted transcriptional regulator YheO
MQAYKLQGKIAPSGQLIISEAINLPAGDVEIILLQLTNTKSSPDSIANGNTQKSKRQVNCEIESLKAWFEKTEPAPPDFDPDLAKWEYLKEKHNL